MQLRRFSYKLYIVPLILMALWPNASGQNALESMRKEHEQVATGTWGGPSVTLNVTRVGGEIQLGCAHGTIEQPLTLDNESRFSAKGTYVADTPGPVFEGRKPKSQAALFSGTVSDQSMTLVVTLTETKEKVGTFLLKHGVAGRVRRCH